MDRIKLSDNFYLDEYIPKELYSQYLYSPHILRCMLDARLIKADQKLREYFGSVIINNWWHGGERNWSGLRTWNSPYYSPTSQHSFGRASDIVIWYSTPAPALNAKFVAVVFRKSAAPTS